MDPLVVRENAEPRLSQCVSLNLVGDWGGANFHRICSWLTQEFCDRAGAGSRTSISSLRDGGMDALQQLRAGLADLVILTPAAMVAQALTGAGMFRTAMPHLRAIGQLPQNDRLVLALDPKFNITSMEELRRQKPALKLATSTNDGTNAIGYVANAYLDAHGISKATLESWGGKVLTAHRPEQCLAMVQAGEADAVLQEAIMTRWWQALIDSNKVSPIAAEEEALATLQASLNLKSNPLPAGFWDSLTIDLPALDFSDFVVLVRDDMSKEVAHLLAWCLVETRHMLEAQYKHIPPQKSPLSYPLDPDKMARTPVPLHDGAKHYYSTRTKSAKSKSLAISPF